MEESSVLFDLVRKYLPRDDRDRVQKTVALLKMRYGLGETSRCRGSHDNPPEEPTSACNTERQSSQGELRWG